LTSFVFGIGWSSRPLLLGTIQAGCHFRAKNPQQTLLNPSHCNGRPGWEHKQGSLFLFDSLCLFKVNGSYDFGLLYISLYFWTRSCDFGTKLGVLSFVAWSVNKHLAFCFASRFCFSDPVELHKILSSILTNFSE
jgi:hypothetical protein